MADFDTSIAKAASVKKAANILPNIQAAYESLKTVQSLLALYVAGTDPAFNAMVNQIFTSAERAKLAAMGTGANTLVTDWETNYPQALQQ